MENSAPASLNNTFSAPSTQGYMSATPSQPGFFSNFDWKMWVLVIFIFAFLGFNVFAFLAQGTQTITDILKPITSLFASTAVQTVNVAATGAETGVNVAANTVDAGLQEVQHVTGGSGSNDTETNSLNNALNNATSAPAENIPGDKPTYQADDSYSAIQASKSSGKSGWCFIGEDRGFRSCIEVGENDKCMSGDIFPTNEICVNPNLRA